MAPHKTPSDLVHHRRSLGHDLSVTCTQHRRWNIAQAGHGDLCSTISGYPGLPKTLGKVLDGKNKQGYFGHFYGY
jgi:hypothetical protein